MKKRIIIAMMAVITIILAACSSGFEGNMNRELGDFSYTNQQHETVTLDDIKGTPTLVNFIFTNCDTVCPPMTYNMSQVQAEIESAGIEDYQIVSFSVDPENDTPEALQEFMSAYEMNEDKWNFLTGYSQKEIIEIALDSFQQIVADDPTTDQVVHQTFFYLINKDGTVVKSYDGITDVPTDEIVSDLKTVAKE
ncbi:SCO family protein [Jeotgalibacillus marinus]|uniref:SCO family protein n=1 Tax=Jeotgalibacillus marinus TaxID=86667 RepID=A0ABV3Q5J8_9BACL